MKRICELQFGKAIEAISGKDFVMYKHGCWNEYKLCKTEDVIKRITKSGYGADVKWDEEADMYYVCTPSQSDMW